MTVTTRMSDCYVHVFEVERIATKHFMWVVCRACGLRDFVRRPKKETA